ncbi:MAG: hypothetical protein N2438_14500, partial [Limisphaera sp.]|nr:hypothetical protein [Limisphaera sp.]
MSTWALNFQTKENISAELCKICTKSRAYVFNVNNLYILFYCQICAATAVNRNRNGCAGRAGFEKPQDKDFVTSLSG